MSFVDRLRRYDLALVTALFIIIAVGIMMMISVSTIFAMEEYNDSYYFIKKHIFFTVVGLAIMAFTAKLDYVGFWKRYSDLILAGTIFLLILVIVPGIGVKVGGARRWIRLGFFSLQPSEVAKLAIIIFFARIIEKHRESIDDFKGVVLPHLAILSFIVLLIFFEKDFGTPVIMSLVIFAMLYVSGLRSGHIVSLVAFFAAVAAIFIIVEPYRVSRITAFLNPWEHTKDKAFQLIQSFIAVGSGGVTGVGLGNGKQKLFFLPEAHTDFILSSIGEELGFIGIIIVLGLFLLVAVRGIVIAKQTVNSYGRLLAFGISTSFAVQAFLNAAVVLGLVPTKGLTLPFLSYGGSSTLVNYVAMGILLNISFQREKFGESSHSGRRNRGASLPGNSYSGRAYGVRRQ